MAENIRIKVILEGQESILTLNEINSKIEELSTQASGLDQTSEDFKAITEEINKLKKALETSIVINVDTKEADEKIQETSSKIKELGDTSVDIQVEANTTDATTNIESLNQEILDSSDIEVDVVVNNSEANQSIKDTTVKAEELNSTVVDINVDANTTEADANIDILNQSIAEINESDVNVDIRVNSDTSEAISDIEKLNGEISGIETTPDIKVNVDIETNTDQAVQNIDSLNQSIDQIKTESDISLDVSVNADTTEAIQNVDDLNKTIEGIQDVSDVKVDVEITANNDEVTDILASTKSEVDALKSDLESPLIINVDNEEANQKIDDTVVKTEELKAPVDITVNANTTEATTNIDNLNQSINEVQDDSVIKLDVNTNRDQIQDLIKDLKEGKKVGEDLSNTDISPKIDPAPVEVITNTTNSVASLRKELINLTAEFENTEVGSERYVQLEQAIGDVSVKLAVAKDRTEDLTDALKLSVGCGVERAKNSFVLLGDGIKNLDFGKISTAVKGLGSVIKDQFTSPLKGMIDGFKQLGSGIKDLNFDSFKSGLSGVTTGFKGLGKAILSTGIGALVIGVTSLISNFDELKESGGFVGKIFTSIGEAVDALVDKFRPLLSALGLVGSEADVKAEKVKAANDKELESITKRYDREIELAKAAGQDTTKIELEKQAVIKQTADSEIALLNEIAIAQGKLNADQRERLAELTAVSEDAAFQTALIQANAQKEIDDKQKESDEKARERREKKLEEEKKYRDTIAQLEEKYNDDALEGIKNKYQKDLDAIKGNSIEEEALRERIKAKQFVEEETFRQKSLDEARKLGQELLTLQTQNEEAALLRVAETEQEKFEIKREYEEKSYDQNLEFITKEKDAAISAIGITAEQKAILEAKYIQDIAKLNEERAKNLQDLTKEQSELVISSSKDQADAIKTEREDILNDSIQGIGILGRLDLLDQNLQKELGLLTKQKDDLIQIQKDIQANEQSTKEEKVAAKKEEERLESEYETKITNIKKQGQDDRAELVNEEIEKRAAQAQELVNIVSSFQSQQIQSQQIENDLQSQSIEEDYNKRKELIEASIQDEQKRAAAIAQLDKDFQGARNEITKKNQELEKKRIKQEANAALAQVLLSSAVGISSAIAAVSKTDPISFALTLAANLATVGLAIKKAKDAYKQANSIASSVGGGGGGSVGGDSGSGSLSSAPSNATTPLVPTTGQAAGVNPIFGEEGANGQGQIIRPVVSVIDIEARLNSNRTSVSEATITPG